MVDKESDPAALVYGEWGGADPLVGPAEAAPVPVLCSSKELLEELEHCVRLQPLPVRLVELLKLWALQVIRGLVLQSLCICTAGYHLDTSATATIKLFCMSDYRQQ